MTSEADSRNMRRALDLAKEALDQGELPIAAIIVIDDRIISQAHNQVKGRNDLLGHAEILSIQVVIAGPTQYRMEERKKMTLYSTLEPCMMCFGAIMAYNIGRLCYALRSPGDGVLPIVNQWERKSEQLPFYKVPDVFSGVLDKESAQLFKDFSELHPRHFLSKWANELSKVAEVKML